MLKWLWLSGLVIILDQITKLVASSQLVLYHQVPVMPMFNLTLMHNTGAAFSLLSDASGWQRWFFTSVALIVSVAIISWLHRLSKDKKWQAVSLALILGGALGNVWDRVSLGYVIDFIQFYYTSYYWPAFNIADSAITIGAVILIIETFWSHKNKTQQASDS